MDLEEIRVREKESKVSFVQVAFALFVDVTENLKRVETGVFSESNSVIF